MKEASGELSMTLVTIIAVGIIVGIFAIFWPQIRDKINETWMNFDKDINKEAGNSGQAGMIVKDYYIDLNN